MNIAKKLFSMILITNIAITTQASEPSKSITFNESNNTELHYDLGQEYYLAEKNNLKRLAISMQQNPFQSFQDLSEEETIAFNQKIKRAIFLSKMSEEQKIAWTAQKIRYKNLKRKEMNTSENGESTFNKKSKTS